MPERRGVGALGNSDDGKGRCLIMPRAAKIKSITAKLTPEQKKHYDNLMAARDAVMGRVKAYAEDALDCSNADSAALLPIWQIWAATVPDTKWVCS